MRNVCMCNPTHSLRCPPPRPLRSPSISRRCRQPLQRLLWAPVASNVRWALAALLMTMLCWQCQHQGALRHQRVQVYNSLQKKPGSYQRRRGVPWYRRRIQRHGSRRRSQMSWSEKWTGYRSQNMLSETTHRRKWCVVRKSLPGELLRRRLPHGSRTMNTNELLLKLGLQPMRNGITRAGRRRTQDVPVYKRLPTNIGSNTYPLNALGRKRWRTGCTTSIWIAN